MGGFLNDNNGNNSLMRVMCLIALLFAGVIAIIGLIKEVDVTYYVTLFLSGAFGGKVAQKKIESNMDLHSDATK